MTSVLLWFLLSFGLEPVLVDVLALGCICCRVCPLGAETLRAMLGAVAAAAAAGFEPLAFVAVVAALLLLVVGVDVDEDSVEPCCDSWGWGDCCWLTG